MAVNTPDSNDGSRSESTGDVNLQFLVYPHNEDQRHWYGQILEELERMGHENEAELWAPTRQIARKGEADSTFDRVHRPLEGFRPEEASGEFEENIRTLERFHQQHPNSRLKQILTTDRFLRSRRWSGEKSVAYAAHLVFSIRALVEGWTRPPDFALGENNSVPFRIAHALVPDSTPYLHIASARHWNDRFFWTDDHQWDWNECRNLYKRYTEEGVPKGLMEKASAKLSKIRRESEAPSYSNGGARTSWQRWAGVGRSLVRETIRELRTRESRVNPRRQTLVDLNPAVRTYRKMKRFRRRRAYRTRASTSVSGTPTFACYFLHYEPEQIVDDNCFHFRSQRAVIENIAAALPPRVSLLVKEHTPMLGRREDSFYRYLESNPNIRFVSDQMGSHSLIERSEIAFSLIGTPALEAVFLQTPSIVFGPVFFEDFKGVHRVEAYNELPPLIDRILNGEADIPTEEAAIASLAAMYEASYSVPNGPLYPLGDVQNSRANRRALASSLLREAET